LVIAIKVESASDSRERLEVVAEAVHHSVVVDVEVAADRGCVETVRDGPQLIVVRDVKVRSDGHRHRHGVRNRSEGSVTLNVHIRLNHGDARQDVGKRDEALIIVHVEVIVDSRHKRECTVHTSQVGAVVKLDTGTTDSKKGWEGTVQVTGGGTIVERVVELNTTGILKEWHHASASSCSKTTHVVESHVLVDPSKLWECSSHRGSVLLAEVDSTGDIR